MCMVRCMDALTREHWLDFALRELGAHGPEAVKALSLATKLGVSRGSFYWHFTSFADFKAALLERWVEVGTKTVIADVNSASTDLLRRLINETFSGAGSVERAMRAWAAADAEVAVTVKTVDEKRIAYAETLLPGPYAAIRARVLYWAAIGRMMTAERTPLSSDDIDALVALFLESP